MDISTKPVLLITKKTFFERHGLELKDAHFLARIGADAVVAERVFREYEENRSAIDAVEHYLADRGLTHARGRGDVDVVDGRYSLVLAVGGDGTLLAASHGVVLTPVAGINSRPGHSVGYFCLADRNSFPRVLDAVFSGKREPRELMRMAVAVNGALLSPPALNDVLYSAENPAASTACRIRYGGQEELQKSAGIWISTPAGSTGGIRAAGGRKMSLSESNMQFLVREPYRGRRSSYALDRGQFTDGFSITNLTPEAAVYVDGARIVHRLVYGDVIEPRFSAHPLRVFL